MGFLGSFMTAASAGLTAFRQSYLNADPQRSSRAGDVFDDWDSWQARRLRYATNFALYQNNTYADEVHTFANTLKTTYALPKSIRNVYSPARRAGEFWAEALMPGSLDLEAGDGETKVSALPIETDNDKIRPAIGQLWKDSFWESKKTVFNRYGSVCGDVGLKICDDQINRRVYLDVIWPGDIEWFHKNPATGETQSYIITRFIPDPREANIAKVSVRENPRDRQRLVRYTERAYLDGDTGTVHYETYINFEPWAPPGYQPKWSTPYGFIPLILCPHESVGLDWGWSCFHAGLSKFREVDTLGSLLGDQIKKNVRGKWLMTGMSNPGDKVGRTPTRPTAENPKPEGEEQDILWTTDSDVRATPMVLPLPIREVSDHIASLTREIEKEYPELCPDLTTSSGDASGRAMRVARQRASAKVQAIRPGYDEVMVRAQKMGVAMGGEAGYKGYEGFKLESYRDGSLDHRIGHRPVFEADPLDMIEELQALWTAAGLAVTAGCPLDIFLAREGWSQKEIGELMTARKAAAAEEVRKEQQKMMLGDPTAASMASYGG